MAVGKEKHIFPGGNTYQGFISFYHEIINQEEASRFVILKGGPGTGKSTFIRKIGEKILQKGYDVEFLHCSSDRDSLDGVKIPNMKFAIIDGTAPHIVDPKNPGAVDHIVNFGAFWDEEGIRSHKKDILKLNGVLKEAYARAYRFLKAAFFIYEDSRAVYEKELERGKINQLTQAWIKEIFEESDFPLIEGKQRSMFASAISPGGYIHYLDSVFTDCRLYEVIGDMGTGEAVVLEAIKCAATSRGYGVEAYYCAFNPGKLEHLVISEIKVAITTANAYHQSSLDKYKTVDMKNFYNTEKIFQYDGILEQNEILFADLMKNVFISLDQAKLQHDLLETYYIPYIDFHKIDQEMEKILRLII